MGSADPDPANAPATVPDRRLQLLAHDPGNLRLRRECIARSLAVRDYTGAEGLVVEGFTLHPGDPGLSFDQVNVLIGRQDYAAAIQRLNDLLRSDPDNPALKQNLGLCHFLCLRFDEAYRYLRQVYDAGNQGPDLLRLLITSMHHLGLVSEAVELADAHRADAQADGALAGVCALLYLDSEEAGKAARFAARALAANPDSIDGLVVQGTLRTGNLDREMARQQFERALVLAPHTGRAWVGLGMLSLLDQQLDRAQTQLEQGLVHMPDHAGSWVVLGWIHTLRQQLSDAEACFAKVIKLDPSFAEGHGSMAYVAALKGDRAAAERLIEVAERLDPASVSPTFARSLLVRGTGDGVGANDLLYGALNRLSPGDDGSMARLIRQITRQ